MVIDESKRSIAFGQRSAYFQQYVDVLDRQPEIAAPAYQLEPFDYSVGINAVAAGCAVSSRKQSDFLIVAHGRYGAASRACCAPDGEFTTHNIDPIFRLNLKLLEVV